ncbi:hypothetical protein D9M68_872560 [compost metagenome]
MFGVVGAGDAVGAQQRLLVHAQADHGEVPVGETQRLVAGGGETEQAVGPVVHAQHALFQKCTHGLGSDERPPLGWPVKKLGKRKGKTLIDHRADNQ